MSRISFHELNQRARRFVSRLRTEISGTASIELVMIAPILMIFMVGTTEISRAINVDKRVNAITSMAGDLISREDDLGGNPTATLDAIMEVVTHVMHPYDPATLKLTVIPIMADAADETRIFVYAPPYTFHGGVGGTPAVNSCYTTLPASVMTKGSTAIIVKAEFVYEPLLVGFFDNFNFIGISGGDVDWDDASATTYTDESIHSPRMGCVDFENNNCVVSTPGAC